MLSEAAINRDKGGEKRGRKRAVKGSSAPIISAPTIEVTADYSWNMASFRSTLAFFKLATLGRPFSNGGKSSPIISGAR